MIMCFEKDVKPFVRFRSPNCFIVLLNNNIAREKNNLILGKICCTRDGVGKRLFTYEIYLNNEMVKICRSVRSINARLNAAIKKSDLITIMVTSITHISFLHSQHQKRHYPNARLGNNAIPRHTPRLRFIQSSNFRIYF